jgi:hypothetical protein
MIAANRKPLNIDDSNEPSLAPRSREVKGFQTHL